MLRASLTSLLLFCLLCFNGCITSKEAQQQAAEKKEAAAKAKEAKQAADIAAAPTPEQKLGVLVQAYPELLKKTTTVIHRTDTVVVKEVVAVASIPTASTPRTDSLLIQSLLQQLAHAGQLVNKAQANALQQSLLPELAKRPLLSRDTTRVTQEGLAIEAWVDRAGAVRVKATRLQQHVAYPAAIWNITPTPVVVQQLSWQEKLVVAGKAYGWGLLLLLLLACFFLVRSIYRSNHK